MDVDTILPFHLLSLALVFVSIVLADREAFAWMRGTKQTLNLKTLLRYHRMVYVGLGLMILTGATMFTLAYDELIVSPAFYVKMTFVGILIINSFFVGKLLPVAATRAYASLTKEERWPLMRSAIISTACWVGAAVTAFFILPE